MLLPIASQKEYQMKIPQITMEIAIYWHIDDVQSIRPDLRAEQASKVLEQLKKEHDASIGINWEVIEITADLLFPLPSSQHPVESST